jgi:hypothetical protein
MKNINSVCAGRFSDVLYDPKRVLELAVIEYRSHCVKYTELSLVRPSHRTYHSVTLVEPLLSLSSGLWTVHDLPKPLGTTTAELL